jgi:tRNA1(Val) A37 N6-methylase TrmN6
MPSRHTANDPEAYQRQMGRWSGLLAEALIDFDGLEAGDRVLDVGCGTASLALALAARPEPAAITGIDIAAPLHRLCRWTLDRFAPRLHCRRRCDARLA